MNKANSRTDVIPLGGLSNRLRALSSLLYLQKLSNLRARVFWGIDNSLSAKWLDLFEPVANTEFVNYQICSDLTRKLISPALWPTRHAIAKRIKRWAMHYYYKHVYDFSGPTGGQIPEKYHFGNRSLVIAWGRFTAFGDYSFIPSQDVSQTVDRYTNLIAENTIGVHIRRKDHIYAIQNSSNEGFMKSLLGIRSQEKETKFYICSDDQETIDIFANILGKSCITRPRCLSRDSLHGMRDAVVDLYLLSKCSRILGSAGSSFSMLAGDLGKKSVEWVDCQGNLTTYKF